MKVLSSLSQIYTVQVTACETNYNTPAWFLSVLKKKIGEKNTSPFSQEHFSWNKQSVLKSQNLTKLLTVISGSVGSSLSKPPAEAPFFFPLVAFTAPEVDGFFFAP